MNTKPRVAIVGAGPSGLSAAADLARHVGPGEVLVIEREEMAGGIPRHSDHPGYGIRDLRRFISGPEYAKRLTASAVEAGAVIECSAMVTGWAGDKKLEVTSPRGRFTLEPDVVILATGARERPRPARRIPGDRPAGVLTTGQLQNLVHLHHFEVGKKALIIGAELVSWSAAMTLREAGCQPVAMTTTYEKSESYGAFRLAGRYGLRIPVLSHTRVVRINGKGRVSGVVVEDTRTSERRTIDCDTVVTTGDWIPDHELARTAGLTLDEGTLGPQVDTTLRTSRPGIFAIGNLLHPVDTADVAALDGKHVSRYVLEALDGVTPAGAAIELRAEPPLRWVAPQLWRPGAPPPPRDRLLFWSDRFENFPVVVARQNGQVIGERRLPWPSAPGRVFRIPFDVVSQARLGDGPVTVALK